MIYTEPADDVLRIIRLGRPRSQSEVSMKTTRKGDSADGIPELTERDFARAIPSKRRERILRGHIAEGDDIVALRKFTGLTQEVFAKALAISVHTLRNREQGRRTPEGPASTLLRVAARHPRVLRENIAAPV